MATGTRKIETIVVAADIDEPSKATIAAAQAYAARARAKMVVVHVIHVLQDKLSKEYPFLIENLEERLRRVAQQGLDAAVEAGKGGDVEVEIEVRQGGEFRQVSNVLNEQKADLLVIGAPSYRKGGGSLAAELAQKANSNMLIVRPEGRFPGRIGVAVDFSSHSMRAAQRAVELARLFEQPGVIMIHAYQLPPMHYLAGVDEETARLHLFQRVQEKFDKLKNELDAEGVVLDLAMGEGRPRNKVPELANEQGVGLLVAGCQGETDAAEVLLGSMARDLVMADQYSVWIERPEGHIRRFIDAIRKLMAPDEV